MTEQLKQCLEIERQTAKLRADFVNEIGEKIKAQPTTAKKIENTGSCRMFTVNFSELTSWNLSPEFYDQEMQAEIVTQRLHATSNVYSLMNHIKDMVDKKSTRVGSTTYRLNPKTIAVLQEVLN